MTDLDSLLAAIIANPDDDALRMVYADKIEERDRPGDAERAREIRHQSLYHTSTYAKRLQYNRESPMLNFLNDILGEWDEVCIRRGFIAEVRGPLAALVGGGACDKCLTVAGIRWCDICHGTGRTPGVLPAIAQAHPLEWVGATDCLPWRNSLNEGTVRYTWLTTELVDARTAGNRDRLPPAIFEILHPWATYRGIVQAGFDSEHDALAALSLALIAWARRKETNGI